MQSLFDDIARVLAEQVPRRTALKRTGWLLMSAFLATVGSQKVNAAPPCNSGTCSSGCCCGGTTGSCCTAAATGSNCCCNGVVSSTTGSTCPSGCIKCANKSGNTC